MANRTNKIDSQPRKISFDAQTNRILEEMATKGLYGKNRTEVASYVIRTWLRENREELRDHQILLVKPGR